MKMYRSLFQIFVLTSLAVFFLAAGCSQNTGGSSESPQPTEKAKPAEETIEEVESVEEIKEEPIKEALLNPDGPAMNQEAPAEYRVKFETSKGDFVLKVTRDWSPKGADRFYNLVKNGFYDEIRFFRIISGFMAQFGINGDPKISAKWSDANIEDDPVKESNTRGRISFAMSGANTRTTQVFINFGNNSRLDGSGFSSFGEVIEGMEVVDSFYSGYGEGAPGGRGPNQGRIQSEGNAYLTQEFPELDYIKTARIIQ